MAKAKLIRVTDSKKSALVSVPDPNGNEFQFGQTIVAYIRPEKFLDKNPGDEVEIPNGYKAEPMVDSETGEMITTEDGNIKHTLRW